MRYDHSGTPLDLFRFLWPTIRWLSFHNRITLKFWGIFGAAFRIKAMPLLCPFHINTTRPCPFRIGRKKCLKHNKCVCCTFWCISECAPQCTDMLKMFPQTISFPLPNYKNYREIHTVFTAGILKKGRTRAPKLQRSLNTALFSAALCKLDFI